MATEKKFKLPITIFELVVYILCALMALWGLVYLVLGFIVNFLRYDHDLVKYDAYITSSSKMGLVLQGILILSIGVIVAVVVLLIFAKGADREFEKQQRRIQVRKNRFKEEKPEQETIVEVESNPVSEPEKVEESKPELEKEPEVQPEENQPEPEKVEEPQEEAKPEESETQPESEEKLDI